jgi:Arc/MetJ family transcription regulator
MATNLGIDEGLLDRAMRESGQRTKKDTVNLALQEMIKHRREARETEKVIELFGTIDFDPKFNYKRERRRR